MKQAGRKPSQRQRDQFEGVFSAFLQDEASSNYNLTLKQQMTQHEGSLCCLEFRKAWQDKGVGASLFCIQSVLLWSCIFIGFLILIPTFLMNTQENKMRHILTLLCHPLFGTPIWEFTRGLSPRVFVSWPLWSVRIKSLNSLGLEGRLMGCESQ